MDQFGETPYKVFRKTEDGQEMVVANHENLREAEGLVATLSEDWPGEYLIRGPQ